MRFDGPNAVEIGGRALECLVCGNGNFYTAREIVVTHGATFLGLEINNPKADVAACSSCGHLHSFLDLPEAE